MKKLFLLNTIVVCCLFGTLRAQYVTIPDAVFASYLQTLVPGCITGNQLDTTCNDVLNTYLIDCSYLPIKDLTGIEYFTGLHSLVCYHDSLATLAPLPRGLKALQCNNNFLTTLPALPDSMYHLQADSNYLTVLPTLPSRLAYLYCRANQLDSLPALPEGLRTLDCENNSLSSLPALPDSMKYINCSENAITALPALPDGVAGLTCRNNLLTALPPLSNWLIDLVCSDNQLDSLPALPAGLVYLSCMDNNLSAIPVLPAQLQIFLCANNQLTALPALPDSVHVLWCSGNRLTALPAFPPYLYSVTCGFNDLTSLPELPDSMEYLYCNSNPNLHCLPRLTTIGQLGFDSANIYCVPNYGNVAYSDVPLTAFPLCNEQNPYGCTAYWNIAGTVYNDSTGDCAKQNDETNVAFIKVNLLQNDSVVQQAYTGGYGSYSLQSDSGSYTIALDTVGLPFSLICPGNGVDTALVAGRDSFTYNHDFAVQCKPGFDVGAWSVATMFLFRPAGVLPVQIHAGDHARFWRQTCNTQSVGGQLTTTISGPCTYFEPAPGALIPTTIVGNTLTYTIADWSAVNPETDFNVKVLPDTTAQPGQQICFTIDVTPGTDNDSTNNQLTQCFDVVASYDPNIKEVYPATLVDVDGDRWLTYTIHFQNTGNSYAENIYITDTLDTDLNAETFQLLSYSFAPKVTITGRAVRFSFYDIMLQDSTTDEPNSHGYVQYKIKVKDNAGPGTVINNTAFIYFDFNAPVVTNTTTNTVALLNGIATVAKGAGSMQVYPNPASDIVTINVGNNLTGGTLTVSDVTGRTLNTVSLASAHSEISTGALSSGVYLVTVVKGEERVVRRLIISR